jgi:hypothetical protein
LRFQDFNIQDGIQSCVSQKYDQNLERESVCV